MIHPSRDVCTRLFVEFGVHLYHFVDSNFSKPYKYTWANSSIICVPLLLLCGSIDNGRGCRAHLIDLINTLKARLLNDDTIKD